MNHTGLSDNSALFSVTRGKDNCIGSSKGEVLGNGPSLFKKKSQQNIKAYIDSMHALAIYNYSSEKVIWYGKLPYKAKHLRGKLLRLEKKIIVHGKMFAAAASFNYECLWLVNILS